MSNMADQDCIEAQSIQGKVLRDVTKSIVRRMDSNDNGWVSPTPELKREVKEVCFLGNWNRNWSNRVYLHSRPREPLVKSPEKLQPRKRSPQRSEDTGCPKLFRTYSMLTKIHHRCRWEEIIPGYGIGFGCILPKNPYLSPTAKSKSFHPLAPPLPTPTLKW